MIKMMKHLCILEVGNVQTIRRTNQSEVQMYFTMFRSVKIERFSLEANISRSLPHDWHDLVITRGPLWE